MNSSENQTNYISYDNLLEAYGHGWLTGGLYLFFNTPLSFIGFIFNALSVVFLSTKRINIPLFKYLKYYSLNSAFICLMSTLTFTSQTGKYFSFSNGYWPTAYRCYVLITFYNTGYLYGSLLDIAISIERVAQLTNRIQIFFKVKPWKVCFILLIVAWLINAPFIALWKPGMVVVPLNSTYSVSMYFLGVSEFGQSKDGKIVSILENIFKEAALVIIGLLERATRAKSARI